MFQNYVPLQCEHCIEQVKFNLWWLCIGYIYPTPRNALFVRPSVTFFTPSNANAHESNEWACALDFAKNDNDNDNEEEEEDNDNDNDDNKEKEEDDKNDNNEEEEEEDKDNKDKANKDKDNKEDEDNKDNKEDNK